MMWLEFLFDRIGGPEVFQAVFDGEKDAWSNPAAIKALTKMQELVKANGFIKGFSSITADSNADQALLYTGKAAMMLHGSWTYGSMKTDGGDFVTGGHLGCMNFPPVEGGKGDPSDTVGNPGQYLSISSKATDGAEGDRQEVLRHRRARRRRGQGVDRHRRGADRQRRRQPARPAPRTPTSSSSSTTSASKAKVFAQSWDQALSPTAAEMLLDNIAKLFQLSITPAAVRRQHERGHRQVTVARVRRSARAGRRPPRRAGRQRRRVALDGAAGAGRSSSPSASIPLLGVLLLSFTTWDGIGDDPPVRADQLAGRAHRSRPAARAVGDVPDHGRCPGLFQTPMSILLGVFLAGHQRYRALLAVLFFIPLLLSSAAIAITYKALLDPNFGLGAGLHLASCPRTGSASRSSPSASSSSSCPGSSSRSTR